jgi:hypothetical protein
MHHPADKRESSCVIGYVVQKRRTCSQAMPCLLQGSCGLLLGALFAQPLFVTPAGVIFWLGQVVGYFIGSIWFVVGALAHIADIAAKVVAADRAML